MMFPDWADDAACRYTDPEIFFPEKNGTTSEAKKICRRCPVQQECAAYAVEHDERFGVWGGISAWERNQNKKRARRLHIV